MEAAYRCPTYLLVHPITHSLAENVRNKILFKRHPFLYIGNITNKILKILFSVSHFRPPHTEHYKHNLLQASTISDPQIGNITNEMLFKCLPYLRPPKTEYYKQNPLQWSYISALHTENISNKKFNSLSASPISDLHKGNSTNKILFQRHPFRISKQRTFQTKFSFGVTHFRPPQREQYKQNPLPASPISDLHTENISNKILSKRYPFQTSINGTFQTQFFLPVSNLNIRNITDKTLFTRHLFQTSK